MTVNVLYLQRYYSRNSNPLKGRRLYERFQRDSAACRLAYIVRPDKECVEPAYARDVVTFAELDELKPDVVFVEGGLVEDNVWRFPEEILEREAARGAVVFLSDVDWNALNMERQAYERVLQLCRVSVADVDGEPGELYDPRNFYHGEKQIVCNPEDIAYADWLAPVYQDLKPFVVALPVPMTAWSELVATCNRSTTRSTAYLGGISFGEPNSGAFAAACRIGLGYLILITGSVSSDAWTEPFPSNIDWLTRLAFHMVERIRIDRRRNTLSYRTFISHRHQNADFAHAFRDELRRRGFGTWLDSRELAAGDELTPDIRTAVEESSHFVLIWSADAAGAEWIDRELNFAAGAGKRILIVRLDETAVPGPFSDKLRIEAAAISAAEAARLVALSLEREEQRRQAATRESET